MNYCDKSWVANFLQNTAIDFSEGVEDADGVICVTREEEREDLEQGTEEQCTQQDVTQCFNTYVTKWDDTDTETWYSKPSIKHVKQYLRCDANCLTFPRYSNAKQEKCEDVFVKTCRIVQRPKTYNHTVRLCRRPLVKKCHEYQESVSVGSHETWQHDWDDTFLVSAPGVRGRVCCSPPTWIRRPAPQLRPVRRPPAPRLSRPGAGQCGVQGHVRDSLQHIHTREQETEIGIDRHINWILLYSFTIHQK